jgi:hypothetical protein
VAKKVTGLVDGVEKRARLRLRTLEIRDQELLERDFDQIPELAPLHIPLRFAEGIRGLQGFVGAELLVGDDTKPMGLGPVGVLTQAAPLDAAAERMGSPAA